jgi:DNA-binding response OmpR family regulator
MEKYTNLLDLRGLIMTSERYLIAIEDDPIVVKTLESMIGIKAVAFDCSQSFQNFTEADEPAAVFVDIHLGLEENGIDLVPQVRERWPYTPIIVVTTDATGDAVGQALAAGANDFVRKPLDPRELVARLRARSVELHEKANREMIHVGDCTLNVSLNQLVGPTGASHMSHSDVKVLQYLLQSDGMTISREELKRKVWGSIAVSDNALDKKMHDVRKAFREVGSLIKLTSNYRQGFCLLIPFNARQVV